MKNQLLLGIGVFLTTFLNAQIAGPNSGSTFSVVAIPGSSATWSNSSNAASSNNAYVTSGSIPSPAGSFTDYLVATNFGFSLPPGVIITGIIVEVERADPNARTSDYSVRIVKAGGISSTERSGGASYAMNDSYQLYGNAGDLWGETWTNNDINNPGFGVAISAQRSVTGSSTAGRIDHIHIYVFYDFAITLPLRLLSFTASKSEDAVLLKWTTAEESNMNYYELQRSTDGRNFLPVHTVSSRNSTSASVYTYTDNNPVNGVAYYRLKMAGHNPGDIRHSAVITVRFTRKTRSALLWPTLLSPGQPINISNPANEKLTVQFFTAAGQQAGAVTTSSNSFSSQVISSQKGILIYRVMNEKGMVNGTGRLVIQ